MNGRGAAAPAPAARTASLLARLSDAVFSPAGDAAASSRVSAATLIALYLSGAFLWIAFFNYGHLTFRVFDWPEMSLYFDVLRRSLTEGTVPYHVSVLMSGTNRFLANPQPLLSPQILLLPYMSTGAFVLFNTLLLYTAGFAGCLYIRRRYRLSLFATAVLLMLVLLHGSVTAHLSVGHPMWTSHFLLPWFLLLVFQMVENPTGRNNDAVLAAKISLVLFAIILQGGFHFAVWCLMLLGVLALGNRQYLRPAVMAIALTGALGACRFIPAAVTYTGGEREFISGFSNLADLLRGLVVPQSYAYRSVFEAPLNLGWWEYDMFVGVAALALLAWFGVYLCARPPAGQVCRHRDLHMPLVVMAVLSLGWFYWPIFSLPLPLVSAERVATRFLTLPLMAVIILACVRLDGWDPHRRAPLVRVLLLAGAIQTAIELVRHAMLWSIPAIEASFDLKRDGRFLKPGLAQSLVINPPEFAGDSGYVAAVNLSVAASLVALGVVLLFLISRAMKNATSSSVNSDTANPAASDSGR